LPNAPIDPFKHGLLRIEGGQEIYWEASGNPQGKPALFLHGGPGIGLGSGGYRRRVDPGTYLVVGIDQRGCGRSRPLAVDALDRLAENTTQALIADIEEVRTHLGIKRWLVSGVSWGTTLALAYAQTHPDRVSAMVLAAVTTTSRAEVDWLTEAVGRIFPEAWQRFDNSSGRREGERIVAAYARRLAGADEADRACAAQDWCAWENVHVSLDPHHVPMTFEDDQALRTFATLVTHYWSHDGFLHDADRIIARMDRISHIPAVLLHGRHDISGPVMTPWRLHQKWPASQLHIVEGEGHGGPEMMERMRLAYDGFSAC
jgi:proline iminopeptidase